MKAFPHQFADLGKAASAIKVVAKLLADGQDPNDQDVFGEALVRSDVVGPGKPPRQIDDYLAEQRRKPLGRQGHRAQARGVRKLLTIMGLIDRIGHKLLLTPLGEQAASRLLEPLEGDGPELWRRVVRQIAITDDQGNTSHPYRMLLRLIAARPGISRAQCALALEARDDTPRELERIVALSAHPENDIRQRLGLKKAKWDDAKKVLPKFAEQLHDIVRAGAGLQISATAIADVGDIHVDSEIMGGEPVFRGTRIPVRAIAAMMEAGADPAQMLEGYPNLARKHLVEAVRWARENPPDDTTAPRENYSPRLVSERRFPRESANNASTRTQT